MQPSCQLPNRPLPHWGLRLPAPLCSTALFWLEKTFILCSLMFANSESSVWGLCLGIILASLCGSCCCCCCWGEGAGCDVSNMKLQKKLIRFAHQWSLPEETLILKTMNVNGKCKHPQPLESFLVFNHTEFHHITTKVSGHSTNPANKPSLCFQAFTTLQPSP